MALIEITSSQHLESIISDNERVVVDFYAPWCGPCKMMLPILEELSDMVAAQFTFVKVNAEDLPDVATQYNVRAVPTLILFSQSEQIAVKAGATTKIDLLRFISDAK